MGPAEAPRTGGVCPTASIALSGFGAGAGTTTAKGQNLVKTSKNALVPLKYSDAGRGKADGIHAKGAQRSESAGGTGARRRGATSSSSQPRYLQAMRSVSLRVLAAAAVYKVGSRLLTGMARKFIGSGGGKQPAAGAGRKAAIVWFRNDLRVHDNEALDVANKDCSSIVPIYCFDPREYGKSLSGFHKTGPYRAKFILESVADLRRRLRELGSELIVRVGKPEEVIPRLVQQLQISQVLCHGEVTHDDLQVEKRVRAAVEGQGAELQVFWGGTLYHLQDLPFKLSAMPTCYGDFKSKMGGVPVRPAANVPVQLKGLPIGSGIEVGELPSLQRLGLEPLGGPGGKNLKLTAGAGDLHGGESSALTHLEGFIRELRAGGSRTSPQLQSNFSGRISPWLSMGCLSARQMYHTMQRELGAALQPQGTAAAPAAAAASDNASSTAPKASEAQLAMFELMWRDFFRFITAKYAAAAAPTGGQANVAVGQVAYA